MLSENEKKLISASKKGDTEVVERLIQKGTDINVKEEKHKETPLMIASLTFISVPF